MDARVGRAAVRLLICFSQCVYGGFTYWSRAVNTEMHMMTVRSGDDENQVAMMWWACGLGDDFSGMTDDDSQTEASQAEERCSCLIQYPLVGYMECALEFGAKSDLNGRWVSGPGPNSGAPRVRDPGGSGFLFILGDSYLD